MPDHSFKKGRQQCHSDWHSRSHISGRLIPVTNVACTQIEVSEICSGICGWSVWEHRHQSCPRAAEERVHSACCCAGAVVHLSQSSSIIICLPAFLPLYAFLDYVHSLTVQESEQRCFGLSIAVLLAEVVRTCRMSRRQERRECRSMAALSSSQLMSPREQSASCLHLGMCATLC